MHAMRGVVRAGVHAARLFLVVAQIAGSGLADYAGFFGAFLAGGENGQLVAHRAVDAELVQVDVAVRTIVGAESAADAPIFDDDFERILAANGAHRTADHA